MKTVCLAQTKYSKDIKIMQMMKPDGTRYFTAKLCGWNGFKFISDTLKAQSLFDKTLEKCKEIAEELKSNPNSIDTLPEIYTF